jgi:hypothetical protein
MTRSRTALLLIADFAAGITVAIWIPRVTESIARRFIIKEHIEEVQNE